MDVKDVISAINFYASQNVIDKSKMVLFGGSHGGFLVTHLSGQYPELNWAACITRNPVTDMAGMTEATDIPDWCWVETFGKDISYTVDKLVCADTLRTMFEKSPMAHVAKVKVPTLVSFLLNSISAYFDSLDVAREKGQARAVHARLEVVPRSESPRR